MSTVVRFTGGGSLDGAELDLPSSRPPAVTTERDGGSSHYVFDDTTGAYQFTGLNDQGRAMGKIARAFSAEARAERDAIEAAMKAKGCPACGLVFGSPGAFTVAHDDGRCLPPGAYGQLVEVSGVWCVRGSDVARR